MNKLFTKPEAAWLISAIVAGALLVAAIFLPLWRMELVAPQYPSGLIMYAYGDHFEGETDGYYKGFDAVREINELNHYIGMKPIETVTEMKLFIPGMLATVAALIAVSFISWHRRWFRGLAIAAAWGLPIFFVIDLQYWLYNYGHTMDEGAALNTGGITPKVVGSTNVWNFHSENSLQIGFFLMMLAAVTITFLPLAIRRAQVWRQRKPTDAGITTETSVGATPPRGKTA